MNNFSALLSYLEHLCLNKRVVQTLLSSLRYVSVFSLSKMMKKTYILSVYKSHIILNQLQCCCHYIQTRCVYYTIQWPLEIPLLLDFAIFLWGQNPVNFTLCNIYCTINNIIRFWNIIEMLYSNKDSGFFFKFNFVNLF